MEAIYLDSAALVKLVKIEPASLELSRYLATRTAQTSSVLSRIEVERAARRSAAECLGNWHELRTQITFLVFSEIVVELAARIAPPNLRTLDAIHLASALLLQPNPEFVTYDRRLAEAARMAGLRVASPGAEL